MEPVTKEQPGETVEGTAVEDTANEQALKPTAKVRAVEHMEQKNNASPVRRSLEA